MSVALTCTSTPPHAKHMDDESYGDWGHIVHSCGHIASLGQFTVSSTMKDDDEETGDEGGKGSGFESRRYGNVYDGSHLPALETFEYDPSCIVFSFEGVVFRAIDAGVVHPKSNELFHVLSLMYFFNFVAYDEHIPFTTT